VDPNDQPPGWLPPPDWAQPPPPLGPFGDQTGPLRRAVVIAAGLVVGGLAIVAGLIWATAVIEKAPARPAPEAAAHAVAGLPTGVTEECPFLLPGGPTTPSGTACGDLAQGAPISTLDCSRVTELPSGLTARSTDASGSPVEGSPIVVTGGACRLTAASNVTEELFTAPTADDVVAVVDFTAPESGQYAVGADARCGSHECIDALASTEGTTRLQEFVNNRWVGLRTQRWKLRAGQVNRIVLWLAGGEETAWLNGQSMSDAPVRVGQPKGYVRFWVSNDSDAGPLEIALNQFAVLPAGG
jgi:hypothetical protein